MKAAQSGGGKGIGAEGGVRCGDFVLVAGNKIRVTVAQCGELSGNDRGGAPSADRRGILLVVGPRGSASFIIRNGGTL